jgi:hypothetical protein
MKRIIVRFRRSSSNTYLEKPLRLVTDYVKCYFNTQHKLIKLGSHSRSFLDFLCEKMSIDDNSIVINLGMKQDFVYHINTVTGGKENPSIDSLSQYVSDFKRMDLIIPHGSKGSGYYCVNPKHFYKGSEKSRFELISKMIEERIAAGLSIRGLIDQPENEFLSD